MSLTTGRKLNRNRWTELPMPQDVIDCVHVLARRSRANRNVTFADREGNSIDKNDEDDPESDSDDSDDEDYLPDVDSSADDSGDDNDDVDNIQPDPVYVIIAGVDDNKNLVEEYKNLEEE